MRRDVVCDISPFELSVSVLGCSNRVVLPFDTLFMCVCVCVCVCVCCDCGRMVCVWCVRERMGGGRRERVIVCASEARRSHCIEIVWFIDCLNLTHTTHHTPHTHTQSHTITHNHTVTHM